MKIVETWALRRDGGIAVSHGDRWEFGAGYALYEWIVGIKYHDFVPDSTTVYLHIGPLWFWVSRCRT